MGRAEYGSYELLNLDSPDSPKQLGRMPSDYSTVVNLDSFQ